MNGVRFTSLYYYGNECYGYYNNKFQVNTFNIHTDEYIKLTKVSQFHLFFTNCKNFSEAISINPYSKAL